MGTISQLIDKSWAIMEANEFDRLGEVFHEDVEFCIGAQAYKGLSELDAAVRPWFAAFPDMRHKIVDEVESGNTYACELLITGTHGGPLATPAGEVPPTGRSIEMRSADYVKVVDGKVVSFHAYPDMPTMLAQLGLGG